MTTGGNRPTRWLRPGLRSLSANREISSTVSPIPYVINRAPLQWLRVVVLYPWVFDNLGHPNSGLRINCQHLGEQIPNFVR